MAASQAALPESQVISRPFTVLGDPNPDVLPASLHPTTFQPIDGLQAHTPSGMTRDLYTTNLRAQKLSPSTMADWKVAEGTSLLRRIGPSNRKQWNALCGQAIGHFPDDPNNACERCRLRGDTRGFNSCRVVAYPTTAERYRVAAKGSCMNCLFSGRGESCSLRLNNNDWAQKVLQAIDPAFSYPNFDAAEDPDFVSWESVVDLAEILEEEDVEKAGTVTRIPSRRRSRAATRISASRVKAQQRACETTPATPTAAAATAGYSPNQQDPFSTGQDAPLETPQKSPNPTPFFREASPLVLRGPAPSLGVASGSSSARRSTRNVFPSGVSPQRITNRTPSRRHISDILTRTPTPALPDSVRSRSHLLSAHSNIQYDATAVGELSRYLPSDPKFRFSSPLSPALRRSVQPQTFTYALSVLRGRMDEIRQDYRLAARDYRAVRQLYEASMEATAGDQSPFPEE